MDGRISNEGLIMEPISDLLKTSSLSVVKEERANTLDPHATEVVNKLFVLFYALCRGFEKQYEDPKKLNIEKTQWIRAFMDMGYNTLERVKYGIKHFRFETPINTPTIGQFLKWCQPTTEDLGFLSKEQAYKKAFEIISPYNQASEYKDISAEQLAIIRHAIQQTGSHELKTLPASKSQPIFERNYEIALRDYNSGKLKPISKAVTDNSAETRELKLQQLIAEDFKRLNSYERAMPWIKRLVGIETHVNDNGV
jgi:hypothetical protein